MKNEVHMSGKIVDLRFRENHKKGILEVQRSSGVVDRIPFITTQDLSFRDDCVSIEGKLQTRNIRGSDGKSHKVMYVHADKVTVNEKCINRNEVEFHGVLVKKDVLRSTPKGKTIMDAVLAINDEDGSQYPSVICWGSVAGDVDSMPIGTEFSVQGRFQSRQYDKQTEEGVKIKTAYEISIGQIEVIDEESNFQKQRDYAFEVEYDSRCN